MRYTTTDGPSKALNAIQDGSLGDKMGNAGFFHSPREKYSIFMKITFVLPRTGLAGGIRVVAIYADRLQKRGHSVTAVSLPPSRLTWKKKFESLFFNGSWPRMKKHPSHFDGLQVDHRILEQSRPVTDTDLPDADVVIATWWKTAEWVQNLKPSKGKKVYFIQGHEIHPNFPLDRVRKTYLMPFYHITISQWLVDILQDNYGLNRVFLVPNSVDCNLFNAQKREMSASPVLGFMYAPESYKGCDICIAAINQARLKYPDLRIAAFGRSRPCAPLHLPENTEFYYQPMQQKISEIYSSCDFWLFSSRAEGFGLPILEAMACRTPVIATKAGAAPELVGKGGGILLDNWSVEGMSDAIVKALAMAPEDWRTMSSRAREIATEYSWDDATLLLEKALASCVEHS